MFYLNLTNGIEFIPKLSGHNNLKFIRIQSTACEQKRWDFILQELDYNFLLDLALGNNVTVVDYGANKEVSRACYQGVEWIRYALNNCWFGKDEKSFVRGTDVTNYFGECYAKLDKRTLKKLNYFKKFLTTKTLHLDYLSASTDKDGNYEYYKTILKEYADEMKTQERIEKMLKKADKILQAGNDNKPKRLKPCPFCGADEESGLHIETIWDGEEKFRVFCEYCGVSTWDFNNKDTAIKAWNTRGGEQ